MPRRFLRGVSLHLYEPLVNVQLSFFDNGAFYCESISTLKKPEYAVFAFSGLEPLLIYRKIQNLPHLY